MDREFLKPRSWEMILSTDLVLEYDKCRAWECVAWGYRSRIRSYAVDDRLSQEIRRWLDTTVPYLLPT